MCRMNRLIGARKKHNWMTVSFDHGTVFLHYET
jgi:hypothetical protein